ncbi:MAG: holo-ACP synthase [Verrucomicrobiota bacterium]
MSERVIGIGVDIVEVSRIEHSMERHPERFLERIFLPDEIAYAQSNRFPAIHLAARFAAKEAVSKAFGTGIGEKLGWRDIEVCKLPHGEPFLRFHGKGKILAEERGVGKTFLSLTHTKEYAAASCVLAGTL